MKTKFLPICLLAAGLTLASHSKSSAQNTSTYGLGGAYFAGIGVTGTYNAGYTHSFVGLNAKRDAGFWTLGSDGAHNGGALMLGSITGEVRLFVVPSLAPSNGGAASQTVTDSDINSAQAQVSIGRKNGAEGGLIKQAYMKIGSMAPADNTPNADYALSVDGKIVAKSVYVTSQNWADYVFEPSYKRLTLPALEQYLQANKHLPNIPSAKEVEDNGYGLGEMDAKLLQSVEELTLHVIELNKHNIELNTRNERIEAELAAMRKQLAAKTVGAKK